MWTNVRSGLTGTQVSTSLWGFLLVSDDSGLHDSCRLLDMNTVDKHTLPMRRLREGGHTEGTLSLSPVFEPGLCDINQIRSHQISRSVMSDSLRPHESQHARPPCPTPGVHPDSRPLSQ